MTAQSGGGDLTDFADLAEGAHQPSIVAPASGHEGRRERDGAGGGVRGIDRPVTELLSRPLEPGRPHVRIIGNSERRFHP